MTGQPSPAPEKTRLRDLSPAQITELAIASGEKRYRGEQIATWLFRRGCLSFEDMTDVSKSSRLNLARRCTVDPLLSLAEDQADPSGARRLMWRLTDGLLVESVLLTEADHLTLCLSTQVGCRMGCRFCRTGTLGLRRSLSQGEILGQIIRTKSLLSASDPPLTNLVFMGMGEPLDNPVNVLRSLEIITSPKFLAIASKRVSLSTVGVVPELRRLAASGGLKAGLTISLGSADDGLRSRLMPSNRAWPLAELKEILSTFPLPPGRRLTFAYVLLEGVNDSPDQARELSRFLTGLRSKVNLIPFNPWPGAPFKRPSAAASLAFRDVLTEKSHTAIIRDTKGASVNAACGLLVADRRQAGTAT